MATATDNRRIVQFQADQSVGSPFKLRRELDILAGSLTPDALLPTIDAGQGNPNNFGHTRTRKAYAELFGLSIRWMEQKRRVEPDLPDLNGDLWKSIVALAKNQSQGSMAVYRDLLKIVDSASYPKQPQPKVLEGEIRKFVRSVHSPDCNADIGPNELLMTSGASGAAQAVLRALVNGGLLSKHDKAVILGPIYAPVVEVCDVLEIASIPIIESYSNDQISEELRECILDPDVKLIITVNPGNPLGNFYSKKWISDLRQKIIPRSDLLIIEDAAYAGFAEAPPSIFDGIPRQTVLLGSFSKIVGMCGIRAGYAALSSDNLIGPRLREQPIPTRYRSRIVDPFNFLERCWLEAGDVSFSHTGSVSTQSLILAAIFSSLWNSDPLDRKNYVAEVKSELDRRQIAFWEGVGLKHELPPLPECSYHCWVDLHDLITRIWSKEDAVQFNQRMTTTEFVKRLAAEQNAIALPGEGFLSNGNPFIRVCVGSLDDERVCKEFGRRLVRGLSSIIVEQ